jgi:hypothetical protein
MKTNMVLVIKKDGSGSNLKAFSATATYTRVTIRERKHDFRYCVLTDIMFSSCFENYMSATLSLDDMHKGMEINPSILVILSINNCDKVD